MKSSERSFIKWNFVPHVFLLLLLLCLGFLFGDFFRIFQFLEWKSLFVSVDNQSMNRTSEYPSLSIFTSTFPLLDKIHPRAKSSVTQPGSALLLAASFLSDERENASFVHFRSVVSHHCAEHKFGRRIGKIRNSSSGALQNRWLSELFFGICTGARSSPQYFKSSPKGRIGILLAGSFEVEGWNL